MCRTPNPADAETCKLCGARLKPTGRLGTPSEEPDSEMRLPATAELPPWLARLRKDVTGRGVIPPEPPDKEEAPPEEEEASPSSEESPEWLGGMRPADSEEEGPPEGEVPAWLAEQAPAAPPSEAAPAADEAGPVPDWLARIRAKAQAEGRAEAPAEEVPAAEPAALQTPSMPPVEPEAPVPQESAAEPTLGLPDWLLGAPPEAATKTEGPVPAEPSWLKEAGRETGGELPHVPALLMDGSAPAPVGDADIGPISVDVPDWMTDLQAPAEAPPPDVRPNLAPATLPAWLEAMRPVETFRSVVEIEPEEDQTVEAAGPLAGLRGVLLAEPVMAMPRTPSVGGGRLEVTERQFAQAELLHRLVEEEQREAKVRPQPKPRPPLLRWLVTIVLFVAAAVPTFAGGPAFPLPRLQPRELDVLASIVDNAPVGQPVLVVFDYEAGYAGELEAVASPLIDHVLSRGLKLATLSTRPTGPPLAERLVAQVAARHGAVRSLDFVHLGYLSGGPTAVQLFAAAPTQAVFRGYLGPGGSPWLEPMLLNVHSLSDFGMVIVVTTGTEIARTWAEQTQAWLGGRPLVMVLSAGAEPLVRPYYESLQPKVQGILSGLPAAVSYELRLGQVGPAASRWNAFGLSLMLVEVFLVAGLLYGLVVWIVQGRKA
ncbi:MAG TPA: hypothetical protein VLD63_08395 [Anaerolineales bacterium]|nr:hypothetical protein [Anaerolineales bacterium]